jgi:diguanylate cyclase (GGDEF)-like protein
MTDDITHLLGTLKGIAPAWTASPPPPYYLNPHIVIEDLKAKNAHLENIATVDALTGLQNRRGTEIALNDAIAEELRHFHGGNGKGVVLVMIDLDKFKPINDIFGHLPGDQVLQEVSRLLENNLRPGDTACRLGGDEFLLILKHTTLAEVQSRLDKLNETINSATIPYKGDKPHLAGSVIEIAASLGFHECAYDDLQKGAEWNLEKADQVMFAIKEDHADSKKRGHEDSIPTPFCPVPL